MSASRGRERTLYVADARDWLTPDEMRTAATWSPDDLDDEVLDRMRIAFTRQPERLDSPSEHLRRAGDSLGYAQARQPDSAGLAI